MYHFWYSNKLARLQEFEGDTPNKFKTTVLGEVVELEYTHCHTTYIPNGGVSWDDTVYLGTGEISHIGDHPFIDELEIDPYQAINRLERAIRFAKSLQEEQ